MVIGSGVSPFPSPLSWSVHAARDTTGELSRILDASFSKHGATESEELCLSDDEMFELWNLLERSWASIFQLLRPISDSSSLNPANMEKAVTKSVWFTSLARLLR